MPSARSNSIGSCLKPRIGVNGIQKASGALLRSVSLRRAVAGMKRSSGGAIPSRARHWREAILSLFRTKDNITSHALLAGRGRRLPDSPLEFAGALQMPAHQDRGDFPVSGLQAFEDLDVLGAADLDPFGAGAP